MEQLSAQFKALGDEHRLKILSTLSEEEICACELLALFNITQPTLSHHLKILSDSGLIHARKDGKWVRYRLNKEAADMFISKIKEIIDN